mmetsp:Transcript_13088/g.34939  ORF Transcript_13088/g.34939 Transcript_13088/m.34939 type:complete len:267 (-) Transcript_13088:4362-5162(-)
MYRCFQVMGQREVEGIQDDTHGADVGFGGLHLQRPHELAQQCVILMPRQSTRHCPQRTHGCINHIGFAICVNLISFMASAPILGIAAFSNHHLQQGHCNIQQAAQAAAGDSTNTACTTTSVRQALIGSSHSISQTAHAHKCAGAPVQLHMGDVEVEIDLWVLWGRQGHQIRELVRALQHQRPQQHQVLLSHRHAGAGQLALELRVNNARDQPHKVLLRCTFRHLLLLLLLLGQVQLTKGPWRVGARRSTQSCSSCCPRYPILAPQS